MLYGVIVRSNDSASLEPTHSRLRLYETLEYLNPPVPASARLTSLDDQSRVGLLPEYLFTCHRLWKPCLPLVCPFDRAHQVSATF